MTNHLLESDGILLVSWVYLQNTNDWQVAGYCFYSRPG